MITPTQLAGAFARNVNVVKWQTEDISDAEAMAQGPFANCLNWVVGHLVANRDNALKLLGEPATLAEATAARYVRESEPITEADAGVLPLSELLGRLEEAQAKLSAALEVATPEALAADRPTASGHNAALQEHLFFLYFHDSYHTGQTELLRQASGRNDKII